MPSVKYRSEHPELGQSILHGFDCSGFVSFVLKTAGLMIPDYIGQDGIRRPIRHANEFWDSYGIAIHDEQKQRADLVFFSRNGVFPTHIGIVRDEETYIHAPGRDGTKVEIKPIDNDLIAVSSTARVIYTRNPIGFKSPSHVIEHPTYRYHQVPIC